MSRKEKAMTAKLPVIKTLKNNTYTVRHRRETRQLEVSQKGYSRGNYSQVSQSGSIGSNKQAEPVRSKLLFEVAYEWNQFVEWNQSVSRHSRRILSITTDSAGAKLLESMGQTPALDPNGLYPCHWFRGWISQRCLHLADP